MRKLAIAAAVSSSLATFSVNSLALGLGDIEMYSALNQTLDAEINILSASADELDSVQVRIAPVAAFASAGVDKSPILSSMKFNIERRADGSPIIKITSDAPVIEPFLNFLIEIDSDASGRQVREFTVLLDPPVFTTAQTQLPIAEVPESEALNIDDEIGASNRIVRTKIDEGEIVDLSDGLDEVGGFEKIDLSNVDLAVDAVNSPVSTTPTGNGSLANYSPTNGSSTEPNADEGEIIPLNAALLGSSGSVQYTSQQGGGSDDASDELGEIVQLDSLNTTGKPIFSDEGEVLGTASISQSTNDELDQGARVDLTDLLAVELVSADSVASEASNAAGETIEIDGLLPAVTDTDSGASLETEALDLSADTQTITSDTDLPTLDEAELVDLSGLEPSAGLASELADQSEVIIDKVEVFTEIASLDTDAAGDSASGVPIDLTGMVAAGAGTTSSGTITVDSQDTLWSIAEDNKPSGVSTQQMMVALLAANQGAFRNNDMNQMLIGAVLDMPATVVAAATGRADALAIVRKQTESQQHTPSAETGPASLIDSDDDISMLPIAEPISVADVTVADTVSESSPGLSIVGADDTANNSGAPTTDELNTGADLSRDLDDVNRRVQLAQEELASEAMQRDELQGRVDDLASSMTKMKRLITLRESELSDLQTGLTTDTDAAETVAATEIEAVTEDIAPVVTEQTDATLAETQARIQEMQEKISDEATLAQDRVAAQADADKNLAAAEAEAQRIRLANEEDKLRLQLATLRAEKADLEETAQSEKAELIRAAEEEKTSLLQQAQAEMDRIQAQLEDENARITAQAEEEKLAIAAKASEENERLIAEANAKRELLAAESDAMRQQLQALEQQKNQLLAQAEIDKQQLQQTADENLRLQAEAEAERQRADDQARIRDRLAEEQAKAAANLATVAGSETENKVSRTDINAVVQVEEPDTDAAAVVEVTESVKAPTSINEVAGQVTDTTGDLASKGTVALGAFGGLMSYAPLQKVVGDRTKALATGGGIALLGLLAAWGLRRRTGSVIKEEAGIDDSYGGVNDERGSNYQRGDRQNRNYGLEQPAQVATATTTASAAAAAVREANNADAQSVERSQEVGRAHDVLDPAEAPRSDGPLQDDTLTEADVYLRYGLHGQAEELLSSAVERDPDNQDYHIKLLENYHDQKNPSGFRAAAADFQDRFGPTEHWQRIAEMGRELEPGDSLYSRAAAMDISAATTGAVAGVAASAVAATSSNDSVTAGNEAIIDIETVNPSELEELADNFLSETAEEVDLDDTIDPGAEFDLSELDATGQFDSSLEQSEPTSLQDVTLDEIDLAALDDDGTLNLEEVAGEEMSGLDLGALDFGDVDGDSSLDSLTLDDANLNSLGGVTASLRDGLESDQGADDIDVDQGSRVDELETMLDLAKAYIDMGDNSSAIGPLKDIAANGSRVQQSEAIELLRKIT